MLVTIIVVLIAILIVAAIWVNAVQQHKEKQEAERRQELSKLKNKIEETEAILMNNANIPMSKAFISILHARIYTALKTMDDISPGSKEVKARLEEAKKRVENRDKIEGSNSDNINLPESDKQIVALVQHIKKMRTVIRSEHSQGKVDTQIFMAEDKRLEKLQLKINIESMLKRGLAARKANMMGSARQYFEKILKTLDGINYQDEYTSTRKAEVSQYLGEITEQLKKANANSVEESNKKDEDDLDVLFAPKKKW